MGSKLPYNQYLNVGYILNKKENKLNNYNKKLMIKKFKKKNKKTKLYFYREIQINNT